ncbi:hypothetical protein Fot_55822 [Forsythia ovata]|uniref:Uncharacterized protein n=1 Tax=Forsythia ovata TaxID=205694 RepID=A0ABD1P3A2_9LAMI
MATWIDWVINNGCDSPHNTLTRDSSNESLVKLRSSSRMNISGIHSGDKGKGSTRRFKEKPKKIRSVDLSYSVEHLVSVGEALVASCQICQEEVSELSPVH